MKKIKEIEEANKKNNAEIQKKLDAAIQNDKDKEKELQEAKKTITKTNEEIVNLKKNSQNKEVQQKLEDSTKKLQDALKESDKFKAENADLIQKNTKAEESISKIKEEYEKKLQSQPENNLLKEENENLKKQIEKMKKDYEQTVEEEHIKNQVMMGSLMDQINELTQALTKEKSLRSSQKMSIDDSKTPKNEPKASNQLTESVFSKSSKNIPDPQPAVPTNLPEFPQNRFL